jgi:hypothetical protein
MPKNHRGRLQVGFRLDELGPGRRCAGTGGTHNGIGASKRISGPKAAHDDAAAQFKSHRSVRARPWSRISKIPYFAPAGPQGQNKHIGLVGARLSNNFRFPSGSEAPTTKRGTPYRALPKHNSMPTGLGRLTSQTVKARLHGPDNRGS